MGRKLPFLPTCGSPDKTLSFRATTTTITAAAGDFVDMAATGETDSSIECVIRGLSSDRFFFKPGKTSSILEEAKPSEKEKEKVLPFKESVSMMEMESTDPFVDFKKSMQEMVDADEGLKEWENLQELLSLYLALNEKINHGYIIRAFVDLMLVNLGASSALPSSCSSSSSMNVQDQSLLMESGGNNNKKMITSSESPESALSFTSSSASSSGTCSTASHCLSSCSLEEEEELEEEDDEDENSAQKVEVSDNASSSSSYSKV
ncbi:transcription repressor OFP15 [Lactuca sativa]|uniref:Transcription repressor n=1 Tax=Lactuca sativa TaxID=4236 RepID=A0A9R1WA80_LACSA|nr:transcription repressor OFP15 [Lactuca sativa]KAJ0220183.1 hypothetical protein LSAT_V11C200069930 [Lactuca sativa]